MHLSRMTVLNKHDIEEIHAAALRILEGTGFGTNCADIRELAKSAGFEENGGAIHIKPGAVEKALAAQRLELDVAELGLPLAELQPDESTAKRAGIGVLKHHLAVEFHGEIGPVGGDLEGLPTGVVMGGLDSLALDETAGRPVLCIPPLPNGRPTRRTGTAH